MNTCRYDAFITMIAFQIYCSPEFNNKKNLIVIIQSKFYLKASKNPGWEFWREIRYLEEVLSQENRFQSD